MVELDPDANSSLGDDHIIQSIAVEVGQRNRIGLLSVRVVIGGIDQSPL